MRPTTIFLLAMLPFALVSCSTAGETIDQHGRRSHPGHYVAIGPGDDLLEINHLDEPSVRGVSKRYFWRTLEPTEGVYDFSSVAEDLDYLAACGKQLVIFLMDKSFSSRSALPGYLGDYEVESDWGGLTPVRWHPYYIGRWLALVGALGEAFDSNPGLEGIAIQESSLGIPGTGYSQFGYTPELYRDALIAILTGTQDRLPSCHVFWYSNFLPDNDSYLYDVADAITESGVFMGGPDILPYRRYLNRVSYPMYEAYRNRITLFCSAQGDSYRHHRNDISVDEQEPLHEEGYLTMSEIFRFARDSLHVRYIFWDHEYAGAEIGAHTYDDAIRVIRRHPMFNRGVGPLGW
jgi:hypothetical protein